MSGHANLSAGNFTGTFTINWPAGTGWKPSNSNLTVTEANGLETVSGSVTSGFRSGKAGRFLHTRQFGRGGGVRARCVVGVINPGCLACWPWPPMGCSEREGY